MSYYYTEDDIRKLVKKCELGKNGMGNNTFDLDQSFLRTLSDFYYDSVTIDFENQESERQSNPGVDWGLPELLSKRRTQKHFKELLEVCFWASIKMEERRHHNFEVVYSPLDHFKDRIVFANALRFADDSLAKLAPATESIFTIGVGPKIGSKDELEVWGLVPRLPTDYVGRPIIRSIGPGQLVISIWGESKARITPVKAEFVEAWLFGDFFESIWPDSPGEHWLVNAQRRDYLWKIGLAMHKHRHGGTLLIVPPEDHTWRTAIDPGSFWFATPYEGTKDNLIRRNDSVRAFATGKFFAPESIERTPPSIKLIGQLTAVDGATIIGPDFEILGFGAKIKNSGIEPSEVSLVDRFERNNPKKITFSEMLGAMRHKSAAWFVFNHEGAIAIVASEDGRLSVFKKKDESSVLAAQDLEFLWI